MSVAVPRMVGPLAVVLACAVVLSVAVVNYLSGQPTFLSGVTPPAGASDSGRFRVGDVLGGEADAGAYLRAEVPVPFEFPRDHGAHPGFRSEWWYFTGVATAKDGRQYGFQFTIFRFEVARGTQLADERERPQIYLGHVALTDVSRGRFYAHERFGRSDLGTGGASGQPLRVWVAGWEMSLTGDEKVRATLRADTETFSLSLDLDALTAPVLQGDAGLSQKGPGLGNASYYYSMPRWRTDGVLTVEGEQVPVEGMAWLDREWSSSALGENQLGWDWFGLRLSDGSSLMYYQLRETGGVSATSSGTWIRPDGTRIALNPENVTLEVLGVWTSSEGQRYPIRWRLMLPDGMALTVEAEVEDQLWRGLFEYWEGLVKVSGTHRSESLTGAGYMELTGYGAEDRP